MRADFTPRCVAIPEAAKYATKTVRRISHDQETLSIDIQGPGFSYARILFDAPVGFRVLDERELCEFWNTYSEPHGWLYEVLSGGWLELERHRATFTDFVKDLREFMIVDEMCINVICGAPPRILDVGADPAGSG